MKAIAWAIVWVALSFAPDINRVTGGTTSEKALQITGLVWFFVSAMFIWAAWPGSSKE